MGALISKKQLCALIAALVVTAAGLAAWIAQLTMGLLATTNLSNVFCWGLLIGMFAFCVGFGAGGQLAASYIVLSKRPELQRFALPAQVAGLGGAIGMTIGDLFDPVYVVYAPKTFILKLCIGLITGLVAHRLGRINEISDKKKVLRYVRAAAVCGLLFNVVFDPMVGYFYKLLILGKPAAQLVLAWNITSTSINAVTSTLVSVAIYMPLRSALIRAGLFDRLR